MNLEEVLTWLGQQGLNFQWRREPNAGGAAALLRPPAGELLPLGSSDVCIVIPDVHLGVGADVFRTANPLATHAARLLKFLRALVALRGQLGPGKLSVVQLGDWYDFYRAPAPTVASQVAEIELQYKEICETARALPIRHCIGNHDAALYTNPHATRSTFGIVQSVGSNALMAYHGHDNKTLQTIQEQDLGATVGLNIANLFALVPLLGGLIDFVEMLVDDSFNEPWSDEGGDKPWDAAAPGSAPEGWQAPWVARSNADKLVRAVRCIEYVTDTAVEVAFVGHTHRPGISSAWVTAERQVCLVDVGSWTYGRAEIAIVTPDGVGLAAIP